MTEKLPIGKIPNLMLAEILARHAPDDPRVVVGPGIGLDSAVLDMGDRYLVAKTDPITFATDLIGWYAVHVNANDVACSGAAPRWFLADLLLPPGQADPALAEDIIQQIDQACRSLGASLVGGHTEVTHGLDRPIVVGCLLGEVAKEELVTAADSQVGDQVLLVGGIPIEGTAIMARELADRLSEEFDAEFLRRCRDFLFDPGLSIVEAASKARSAGPVHAMHDPTEGGLAGGLWELAHASGKSLLVHRDRIPVLPEGQKLCDALGLDPLATIASGALLITADGPASERILQAFRQSDTLCVAIGEVTGASGSSVELQSPDGISPLPLPERDAIAALFEA